MNAAAPQSSLIRSIMDLLGFIGRGDARSPAPPVSASPKVSPAPTTRPVAHHADEIYAPHWSEVDLSAWPWPNFSPQELASKGNGAVRINVDALNRLQLLRERWGGPLRINSAYRDPVYNERIGGAKLSQHKKGRAFDISVRGFSAAERSRLVHLAAECGFTGFGGYNTFLHVDNARPRRWGQAWGHPKGASE